MIFNCYFESNATDVFGCVIQNQTLSSFTIRNNEYLRVNEYLLMSHGGFSAFRFHIEQDSNRVEGNFYYEHWYN